VEFFCFACLWLCRRIIDDEEEMYRFVPHNPLPQRGGPGKLDHLNGTDSPRGIEQIVESPQTFSLLGALEMDPSRFVGGHVTTGCAFPSAIFLPYWAPIDEGGNTDSTYRLKMVRIPPA